MDKLEIITLISNELRKCIDNGTLQYDNSVKYHTEDGIFKFHWSKIFRQDELSQEFSVNYNNIKDGKIIKIGNGIGTFCYTEPMPIGRQYYTLINGFLWSKDIKIKNNTMTKCQIKEAIKYFKDFDGEYEKKQIEILNQLIISNIDILALVIDDILELVNFFKSYNKFIGTRLVYNQLYIDQNNVQSNYMYIKKIINNKVFITRLSIKNIPDDYKLINNKKDKKIKQIKNYRYPTYEKDYIYKDKLITLHQDMSYNKTNEIYHIERYKDIQDIVNCQIIKNFFPPEIIYYISSYL